MVPPPFHAVTVKAIGGKLREIVTDAEIFVAKDILNLFKVTRKSESVKAIGDTGATNTVISSTIASRLGLIPTGKASARDANREYESNTYIVDIGLPNHIMIENVQVTEAINLGTYDLLIGMDLITIGDFVITNATGNTWFSFRIPPDGIHIDYVARAEEIQKKKIRRDKGKHKKKIR